jgi:hypothetical protein
MHYWLPYFRLTKCGSFILNYDHENTEIICLCYFPFIS